MQNALLSIGILFIAIGVFALLFFLVKSRKAKRNRISKSLQLQLLKIELPTVEKPKEQTQDTGIAGIREKVALMEQLLSQLTSIKKKGIKDLFKAHPFFTLEIAVQNSGKEIGFYVALPRRFVPSFEKAIQGVYPDANVELSQDYTIFHPEGTGSGALIKSKDKYLPIKSYQTLEGDPLGGVLNAFSKVAEEKEGMALQIILQNAPPSASSHLLELLKHLRKGKTLNEAKSLAKKTNLNSLKSDKKKEGEEISQPTPPDQQLIEKLEKKYQKALFNCNIRLLTAAHDKARADALLHEVSTPFSQYTVPDLNSLLITEPKGRKLQKLFYDFAFRLPQAKNSSYLSTEEIASIFHLPNTSHGVAHVSSSKAKLAPLPSNAPSDGILLGTNVYRGSENPVYMTEADRARHFYIIGQTGTGKSNFMLSLIKQDIKDGHGVCFIDPHGDGAEEVLRSIPPERIRDVIYFNPGDVERPMGLNLLEYNPAFPEQKTFIINELMEIFNKLYDMKTAGGPMFEQYFRNATALVMDDPESGNTLLEINRVFVDKAFRDLKLSKTTNPLVQTFWREVAEKAGGEASLANIVPYISSKFDTFLSNEIMRPIVAQEKSSINVRDVMDNKKILLINLSKGRLGELNSSLIGLIMVGKILMSAFSRIDTQESERKQFYLYIDEFQNVTTNSIETILSEARKYRLNLIIAHQFIAQLEEDIAKAVFGNVGSMASFRIGAEDAEFMEKQFGPTFSAKDLMNIDNYNCYLKLLINGQTANPFSMKTIPPTQGSAEIAQKAVEYSRLTYGRDKASVVAEISKKFQAVEKREEQLSRF